MHALASKSGHIPFRDSKLTQLLQDSLSGQAKTMMFMHVAPEVRAPAPLFAHRPGRRCRRASASSPSRLCCTACCRPAAGPVSTLRQHP